MNKFLSKESSSPEQQSCHRDPTKGEKYEKLRRKPAPVGENKGGTEGQGGGRRRQHTGKAPKTNRKERVISKKSDQAQNQRENTEGR